MFQDSLVWSFIKYRWENLRGRAFVADPKIPTLAEILKSENYRTAAFTDGGNLYPELGFSRGFDYYSINRGFGKKKALIPEQDILYWIKSSRNEKFFLFFHTYAVHSPWSVPNQYQNIFSGGKTPYIFPNNDEYDAKDFAEMYIRELKEYLLLVKTITEKKDPDLIEHLKNLYDGAIVYVDDFVGKLFGQLEKLKLLDNTIIIFTADHGEEFLEHGRLSHRQFYNELLHVPLIINGPVIQRDVMNDHLVRSIDIFPTILDILGLSYNKLSIHGISLLRRGEAGNLPIIAEADSLGYAAQDTEFKLIYPKYKNAEENGFELYDLKNDPFEKKNTAITEQDAVSKMRGAFEKELHERVILNVPQRNFFHLM